MTCLYILLGVLVIIILLLCLFAVATNEHNASPWIRFHCYIINYNTIRQQQGKCKHFDGIVPHKDKRIIKVIASEFWLIQSRVTRIKELRCLMKVWKETVGFKSPSAILLYDRHSNLRMRIVYKGIKEN